MGTFSIWHWLIVLVVVLVLFGGGGKLSRLMGDAGKGIRSFKKGLQSNEEDSASADKEESTKAIEQGTATASTTTEQPEKEKAASG